MKDLLESLKKTIVDLKTNRKNYNWYKIACCNCGVLAQNVCNMSEDEVFNAVCNQGGTFHCIIERCEATGAPMNIVMKKLHSIGLSNADISNIEFLGNEQILKEAGLIKDGWYYESLSRIIASTKDKMNKESVIRYFEAWVRIIERGEWKSAQEPTEEIKIEPAPEEPKIITVYKVVKVSLPEFEPNLN